MNCPNCGGTVPPGVSRCVKCGSYVEQPSAPPAPGPSAPPAAVPGVGQVPTGPAVKSKLAAGLLGIFLGSLGIHRFYLGYTSIGVTMLVLTLVGWILIPACGFGLLVVIPVAIWGLVEGIMILTGSIDRDDQGRPLRD